LYKLLNVCLFDESVKKKISLWKKFHFRPGLDLELYPDLHSSQSLDLDLATLKKLILFFSGAGRKRTLSSSSSSSDENADNQQQQHQQIPENSTSTGTGKFLQIVSHMQKGFNPCIRGPDGVV
jgi:hypothetical protein